MKYHAGDIDFLKGLSDTWWNGIHGKWVDRGSELNLLLVIVDPRIPLQEVGSKPPRIQKPENPPTQLRPTGRNIDMQRLCELY